MWQPLLDEALYLWHKLLLPCLQLLPGACSRYTGAGNCRPSNIYFREYLLLYTCIAFGEDRAQSVLHIISSVSYVHAAVGQVAPQAASNGTLIDLKKRCYSGIAFFVGIPRYSLICIGSKVNLFIRIFLY